VAICNENRSNSRRFSLSRRISITSAPKSSSRVRKAANAAWSGSGPCSTVSTGAGAALSNSKSSKTSIGSIPATRIS